MDTLAQTERGCMIKLTEEELSNLGYFLNDLEVRRREGLCLDGDVTRVRVNDKLITIDHSGQEIVAVIE